MNLILDALFMRIRVLFYLVFRVTFLQLIVCQLFSTISNESFCNNDGVLKINVGFLRKFLIKIISEKSAKHIIILQTLQL